MNIIKKFFFNIGEKARIKLEVKAAAKQKEIELKQQAEEVIVEYQDLINEFRLIQEKKSNLSKSQRDMVELKIRHLISKGHIVVGQ